MQGTYRRGRPETSPGVASTSSFYRSGSFAVTLQARPERFTLIKELPEHQQPRHMPTEASATLCFPRLSMPLHPNRQGAEGNRFPGQRSLSSCRRVPLLPAALVTLQDGRNRVSSIMVKSSRMQRGLERRTFSLLNTYDVRCFCDRGPKRLQLTDHVHETSVQLNDDRPVRQGADAERQGAVAKAAALLNCAGRKPANTRCSRSRSSQGEAKPAAPPPDKLHRAC